MATAVKRVIEKTGVKDVFIEGGSTAAEIINELGITQLLPIEEWQRGVVRMKAGELFITVKPGSYDLPSQIKTIYSSNN
jgi:D-threonate/D-erythronate kinase